MADLKATTPPTEGTRDHVHQLLTEALSACDVDEVERLTALLDKLERAESDIAPPSSSQKA